MERGRKRAWIAVGIALVVLGGTIAYALSAVDPSPDRMAEERRALEREGFTNVRVVGGSGSRFELEGERGDERCTVQIEILASGERRRARACEGTEPLEALERACEAGELERCVEASERVRSSPPIDWPRATRSSVRACEGGIGRECLFVGMAHEYGGRGVPQDLAAARAMYERACAAGSTPACARVR